METLGIAWYLGVLPAGLAVALSALVIVRWRARMQWRNWEWISLVAPVAIWWALALLDIRGKSLANLIEVWVIALAVPVCVAARALIGTRVGPSVAARGMAWTLGAVAIGVYLFVPVLPE